MACFYAVIQHIHVVDVYDELKTNFFTEKIKSKLKQRYNIATLCLYKYTSFSSILLKN